jgi:hypothetical protein
MHFRVLRYFVFLSLIVGKGLHAEEVKLSEHLTIQKHPELKEQFICDIGHATFTSPKGWVPHPSEQNTYAILAPNGVKNVDERTKLITIEVGNPKNETVQEMGESFAKFLNAKLTEKPPKLDGEEAVRIKAIANPEKFFPVDSVIVYHGGRSFLLIGGAKEKDSVTEALDEIVRTWKWK